MKPIPSLIMQAAGSPVMSPDQYSCRTAPCRFIFVADPSGCHSNKLPQETNVARWRKFVYVNMYPPQTNIDIQNTCSVLFWKANWLCMPDTGETPYCRVVLYFLTGVFSNPNVLSWGGGGGGGGRTVRIQGSFRKWLLPWIYLYSWFPTVIKIPT